VQIRPVQGGTPCDTSDLVTRSRRALLAVSSMALVLAAVFFARTARVAPHVRNLAIASLEGRLDSKAEIESLHVSVFPRPQLSGTGLSLRWKGRTDVPPLVRIGEFSASAGIYGLLGTPVRLRSVELDSLTIHVPVGGLRLKNEDHGAPSAQPDAPGIAPHARRTGRDALAIDEVIAHAARLEIASTKAGKPPRAFDIHDLHIFGFGQHDGADFQAILTNPTPEGRVQTVGRFGPWRSDQPRRTPLHGNYVFKRADLDTIKGLGGTLSSHGTYDGVLERIEIEGETETPDFSIDVAGQPVPLTTRFKAVVDGTNGDTWLEEVMATLQESRIQARGAVVRAEDVKGRHVALDITIEKARIEDLLKLAMKDTRAPLKGAVRMTTKFLLPAGPEDVIRKLRLDGTFALDQATFTNLDVQRRISELSQRGRGDETPVEGQSVVSKLRGRFALRNSSLRFSDLTFAVPGAMVQLAGRYELEAETLDFTGHLLLDASLRDTTSGFKAVLALIAQPFFRRPGGGSRLPIRIAGTRSKPQFGLDLKKAFLTGS
jgi:hypothetical protein